MSNITGCKYLPLHLYVEVFATRRQGIKPGKVSGHHNGAHNFKCQYKLLVTATLKKIFYKTAFIAFIYRTE